MNPVKTTLILGLVALMAFQPHAKTTEQSFSLGIDKYNDLYMVDSSSGAVHHFDSQTGIYLGKFTDAKEIGAESITDISVCACGGAIALLDTEGNTVHTVDFEGNFLWKKDSSEQGMNFKDGVGIGICQDSNYEHVILTSKSGEVFHVSPPNEQNKPFADRLNNPGGAYMDFFKQVFIAETGAKRALKFDQWGANMQSFGEGILNKPVDIATSEDRERKIWVCDQGDAKLHVFSKDLKHLFDAGEGYLTNPVSVITDYVDSGAYVAEIVDGKPVIHKFDQNGAYLFTIKDALGVPVQSLLSATVGSYVLQNRNNRAQNVSFKNKPETQDGKVYVEVRGIFGSLGYGVAWHDKSRVAEMSKGSENITISTTGTVAVNGLKQSKTYKIILSKGRMMVPTDIFELLSDVSVSVSGDTLFFVSPKLLPWQMMPQPDLGKNLYETKCSRCHQPPVPDVKFRSEWMPIVQRMMAKDPSWISPREADLITRYLWGQAKPDKPD